MRSSISEGKIFPYAITLREGGNIETVPVVQVRAKNKEGDDVSLLCIIDSGAHISLLPEEDLEMLSSVSHKGASLFVGGIAGVPLQTTVRTIRITIGESSLRVPISFAKGPVPRVLGRKGVFNKFTIVFEEPLKRVAFIPSTTKTSRVIRQTIDSLS